MLKRRDVLQLAGTAAAVAAFSPASAAPAENQKPDAAPFSSSSVLDLAKSVAAKPFSAPSTNLPAPLTNLSREAFAAIKIKPDGLIWNDKSSGFVIEPLHRGFVYTSPMQVYLVEDGMSRRLNYDASQFDFGGLSLKPPPANLDFSGFRVLRRDEKGGLHEIAVFQGASFFRSAAPGQILGVTSRGLSIRTGDPRGEEFPLFRAVWIQKASVADNALTINALLDSESVAGAYRFTIHPGDATIIDVECSLFPRATIDVYGLATMSATSLFSPLDRRGDDDVRDAATELTGLQMLTGAGEWLWRPVTNRSNLQISEFVDSNPKGFGFLQRHRAFDDFYDFAQHWELKPSLWIEPIGDWGDGSVELVEIPSDNESAQNMVAFWRSKTPLVKGQQADFAYRQFWCWSPPSRPPLAKTTDSRGGRGPAAKQRRFLVEFRGDALGDSARVADLKPNLSVSPGKVIAQHLYPAPERKSCYVQFDMDPAGETACEIRLTLDVQGAPQTETWLYRWTT
ncbi:glucan biosynthesis protein D [Rhodoblastus acidophilus]|uniref:Glucan biosynthesis protein D n=1 Tax=Candidatus Rhodoblastus alkanivorans TaxID=2954117 RepID=A0ABS9Z9M7_9HYPH|nr:glucan biosynthesis protein D [Candidatus Rhodoblastus alkanivorans]MCI4679798.1 glucan biosynthesis protein D [Candidatus Rhodoblastus alkanivorans]MCI4684282.1 glucan biosynthesis protein D [Candidatus Rhodoblastus alkanivorans]MDI4641602.1 glucan biosynthesis protein D [Rhodoblastus acidophilus]